MTIRHIKYEAGNFTYDTETGKWTKLSFYNNNKDDDALPLTDYKVMEETPLDSHSKIVKPMPGNYIPELSSNNEIWDIGRRLRSREKEG